MAQPTKKPTRKVAAAAGTGSLVAVCMTVGFPIEVALYVEAGVVVASVAAYITKDNFQ